MFLKYFVNQEHRYYGKSRPTKDLSERNLHWMTSKHTVEDLKYRLVRFLIDSADIQGCNSIDIFSSPYLSRTCPQVMF